MPWRDTDGTIRLYAERMTPDRLERLRETRSNLDESIFEYLNTRFGDDTEIEVMLAAIWLEIDRIVDAENERLNR